MSATAKSGGPWWSHASIAEDLKLGRVYFPPRSYSAGRGTVNRGPSPQALDALEIVLAGRRGEIANLIHRTRETLDGDDRCHFVDRRLQWQFASGARIELAAWEPGGAPPSSGSRFDFIGLDGIDGFDVNTLLKARAMLIPSSMEAPTRFRGTRHLDHDRNRLFARTIQEPVSSFAVRQLEGHRTDQAVARSPGARKSFSAPERHPGGKDDDNE